MYFKTEKFLHKYSHYFQFLLCRECAQVIPTESGKVVNIYDQHHLHLCANREDADQPPPPCSLFRVSCFSSPEQSMPGRVVQSVGHLTRKSEVLGSIPGLATYFRFSFR